MISYIDGILKYKAEDYVIVDNGGGIGFKIFASSATIGRLPSVDKQVKLFTYMNVKEDDLSLFGFLSMEELDMFNRLITVKGVGPKGAVAMLATLTPAQISLAIITDDIKTLSSGQGIGKKTAQQIILDLKGKISTESAMGATLDGNIATAAVTNKDNSSRSEAIDALLSLGFSRAEVIKAVDAVAVEDLMSSEIISRALRLL